jgi:hypothetical protein
MQWQHGFRAGDAADFVSVGWSPECVDSPQRVSPQGLPTLTGVSGFQSPRL